MPRESMQYDVVIAGAGPAGLSAAIRLKQLKPEMSVCVLEKGSAVGSHILSGVAFDPKALTELIPDWKEKGAPLDTPVTSDAFCLLTGKGAIPLPVPPGMHNKGCYVGSLANLCRWLAQQAEALGVEIFPGFPASEALIEEGRVVGVRVGDFGVDSKGEPKPSYQQGPDIRATHTLLAEGCRGHLSEQMMKQFDSRKDSDPQTYGIGLKEIWEVKPEKHKPGHVMHTIGWPLQSSNYGGSFVYHLSDNQVAIGFVVGLDYKNPHLDPFREFQRFKHHPKIASLLEGGRRIAYGARALNEGGLQAVPQLTFPGGAYIGCAAGFLNVGRIKGSHTAMKSGMLAAEAIAGGDIEQYPASYRESWIYKELHATRNLRPIFHRYGLYIGMVLNGLETFLFKGKLPWTSHITEPDHTQLLPAAKCRKIEYPEPDGVLSFDRMSSVYLSNTNHEEDQPCHLQLRDGTLPVSLNLPEYDAPERRYCPAGVYEIVQEDYGPRLHINAQNCVHCKTCDIKDPSQNIHWVTPEGGGGPNYGNM